MRDWLQCKFWYNLPSCLLQLLSASRTDFARFVRSAKRWGSTSTAELFPCPIPYAWDTCAFPQGSRRQRRRYLERRALDVAINLQVCALNFCYLNMPPWCPPSGCRGMLNQQQGAMISSLRRRTRAQSRLVGDLASGCGLKLTAVQSELDSLESVLDSLRDLVYGSAKQRTAASSQDSSSEVVPTVASKVAFPQKLLDFDPSPFLPEPYLTAFRDPDQLLLGKAVLSPAAPITSARVELWQLFWRWDQVNRLCLAFESEIVAEHSCNLFCLEKPDGELRQIIDRRPRNGVESDPPKSGPKMGHASMFLQLIIPPGGCLRGSLDDLRNFYHSFQVSTSRALSTPVWPPWRVRDFRGSAALHALKVRHPNEHIAEGRRVFACFSGLSMGDKWAPAIAQVSHEEVLKQAGALRKEEHLQFGAPLPRAPEGHYSGVCIDDRACIQIFPRFVPEGASSFEVAGRDLVSCAQAEEAYRAVGLETHPKKAVRRAANFKVWGAHFQGDCGLLSMDCTKLAALCLVTSRVASLGICTEKLLQKLLGLWAFACQFRRPMFALFSESCSMSHLHGKPSEPFRMPRALQQELQLAAALGMLASTSLRTQVCETVFATDASPEGAGLVSCAVGAEVAKELYRRTETRGFHMRLLSPVGAYLHSQGFDVEEPEFLLRVSEPLDPAEDSPEDKPSFARCSAPGTCRLPEQLQVLFQQLAAASLRSGSLVISSFRLDFVELYSGTAGMSRAMHQAGFLVGPPLERRDGWDLANLELFELLLRLCRSGRISVLWMGPPCTTFSLTRGFDMLLDQVISGNLHMYQSLALFLAQAQTGQEALLETPWGAYSRKLPWWRFLADCCFEFRLDQCRFGTPYQKATGLLATSRKYASLGRRCMCSRPHVRLEGAETSKAAEYPALLCSEFARISVEHAKACQSDEHGFRPPAPECVTADLRDSRSQRRFVSHLWSTQLAEALPWKVCRAYRFKRPNHINVLESHAHKTLMAISPWDCRLGVTADLRDSRSQRRFVSHLWSTQLAEALPWKVCRAYRFKRPNHINVLESHAHKTLMAISPWDCRLVVFQDSMVTLGANAKGRSSSSALNRIMRQSLAFQLGKNVYASGIHCPTWALRADDPSRSRRLRLPRAPLPPWFLRLRRGCVGQAQNQLDAASGTARSLGRWLLFGGAATLAAAGDFDSIGAWASSSSHPSGSAGPRTRQGYGTHGRHPAATAQRVLSMAGSGGRLVSSSGRDGHEGTDPSGHPAGGVWSAPLRTRSNETAVRRDHQHHCPTIPICEDWPVATADNLGDIASEQAAPATASSGTTSLGGDCTGMGLGQICDAPFDRLLRLVEALRALSVAGNGLCTGPRNWPSRCPLHPPDFGQVQDARSQDAKRPARCPLCSALPPAAFSSHESFREALVSLHIPVPAAPPIRP